jgi:hypothetical protein
MLKILTTRRLEILTAAILCLLIVWLVGDVASKADQKRSETSWTKFSDEQGPPPSIPQHIERRTKSEAIDPMGIGLDPADAGLEPEVTGERAIAQAWQADPWPGSSLINASFGLFSDSQFEDEKGQAPKMRPTWEITYQGVCVPKYGPVRESDELVCAATEEHVMIDATTGDFLLAFASS